MRNSQSRGFSRCVTVRLSLHHLGSPKQPAPARRLDGGGGLLRNEDPCVPNQMHIDGFVRPKPSAPGAPAPRPASRSLVPADEYHGLILQIFTVLHDQSHVRSRPPPPPQSPCESNPSSGAPHSRRLLLPLKMSHQVWMNLAAAGRP